MLTGKSVSQNALPIPVSLGFNVLFEKTDISTPLQKQTIAKTLEREQVELDPYPESDYQWLVEVLEALTDIVNRNVNNDFAALTEADYEQLDAVLKELIYTVGDDEKHPLAPLMDFIGVLTSQYEDKHFPKLTELFPELAENVNPNDAKDENQQDTPTKERKKSTKALAAEAFFSIGSLFFKGGREEKAIFAYDQTVYLNPEHTHAYYNRGRAKGWLGQYKAAIADFDNGIKLNPDHAYAYFMRGCAKVELEQYEAAIADFDNGIKLNPGCVQAYFGRGSVKIGLEFYTAAIADFDEIIRLEPDNAQGYFGRGYAKYGMGEYNSAIADFDETIRLEPDNAQAYNNRGHLKNRLGQYKSALTDYNKSIQLNPNDAWPYANRGFAKIKLGQPESAFTDCEEAIRRNPSLAEAYHTRGEAGALLGRTQEAKADFQKALDLAEQDENQDLKAEIEQSLKELNNTE